MNWLVLAPESWEPTAMSLVALAENNKVSRNGKRSALLLLSPESIPNEQKLSRGHRDRALQIVFFKFLGFGVRLSPLGTSATIWPIAPAPDDR
jgi:hypothetical protein